MPTHVVLIRGINVGRAKRVAMADLRALVEGLGHRDVRTLLNSGNVVFTASGRVEAAAIEQAMTTQLGVSARVTVLTRKDLAAIVADHPLAKVAGDPARLLVCVLRQPADRKHLLALAKQSWAPEVIALGRRAAYLWCAGGIVDSRVWKAVERALGDGVTARNRSTIEKLLAMVEGAR